MRNRRAFTLVELLVAMALTMFIMAILSQAFVTSLEVFSQLKGIGDMEEGLRAAAQVLRNDLSRDHFSAKRRLSDPDFWNERIPEGFFHIRHFSKVGVGSPPFYYQEGVDQDGLPSYVARNHLLYFTVKHRGNRRENFSSAFVPPLVPNGSPPLPVVFNPLLTNPNYTNFFEQPADASYQEGTGYSSPWEEVAYFLVPTGTTTDPLNPAAPSGTPLHALFRFQAVMVPRNAEINGLPPPGQTGPVPGTPIGVTNAALINSPAMEYPHVSCIPYPNPNNLPKYRGKLYFATPSDVSVGSADIPTGPGPVPSVRLPARLMRSLDTSMLPPGRRGAAPGLPFPPGSALVLSNVISFQVRVLSNDRRPNPTPPPAFPVLGDFSDIETNPSPTPQPIYPATWDSSLPAITDASRYPPNVLNATQTVITSPNHGLSKAFAKQPIYIKGVRGNITVNTDTSGALIVDVPIDPNTGQPDANRFVINRRSLGNINNPNLYTGGGVWSLNPIFRIKALEITIRIWDSKTQQARQLTMVQDM